jgi:hypothetical protein
MTPKTPSELKTQIEKQRERPAKKDHERTAEGKEVPTPKRGDFFGNLDKAAKSQE